MHAFGPRAVLASNAALVRVVCSLMVADGACSGTVKKPFGSDGIHSDVAEVLLGRPGVNIG